MKVGDLVRYRAAGVGIAIGIVMRLDADGDPVIYQTHNGVTIAHWKTSVKKVEA